MSGRLKWSMWVLLAIALAVALTIGASKPSGSSSAAQRAASIDANLRCPSCEGISVADSSALTAVAIRKDVQTRVDEGQSTSQIESFLESRYGTSILLRPPASGLTATVWVAPVVAIGIGLAALGALFWRRRRIAPVEVSQTDRDLVEDAMTLARSGGRST